MLNSYNDASLSNYHTSVNYSTTRNYGAKNRLYNYAITAITLFVILFSVPALAQCPPGLIHHFPLDETEAGAYMDNVSPVTATCTDCPTPVSSLFAGGQRFDGRNDGLVIEDIEKFQWGLYDSFTIEFWIKTEGKSSQNQVVIGRSSSNLNMSWWVGVDQEGYVIFELYDMKRAGFKIEKRGKKVNDGKWHHVVAVRHGTQHWNRLYIDGYRAANFTYKYEGNFYSTFPVTIGRHKLDNGYHFAGALDELMVYNRALEENEVRSRYNYGASVYCGTKSFGPTIMSEPITFGTDGQAYFYDVQAIGSPLPTYSLTESPAGMRINASTGEITWASALTGKHKVSVKVTNGSGEASQDFTIEVKKGIGESAGMLHHWMLHEVSGRRFRDYYTPYDAVCEPEARPSPIAGVVSGGQRFDGQTTGLDVSNSSNFNWNPDESFSLELWVRTTSAGPGNKVFIGRQGYDSETHWWIGMDGQGYATFYLLDILWQGIGLEKSGVPLTDGKWHQIVAIKDGNQHVNKLYVDGQLVNSGSFKYVNSFASQSPVNIGYLDVADKYRFNGDIDEVKLFGRVLSAEEIQDRYQKTYDAIIELAKFEGRYANEKVHLNWETQSEIELANFVIERSEDGMDFQEIGTVPASGTSTTLLAYNFTDTDPIVGTGYYRLRVVKQNGNYTYSNIITVEYGGAIGSRFYVYPNPVQDNQVTVSVSNLQPEEPVMVMLSNLAGKRFVIEKLSVDPSGVLEFKLTLPNDLSGGMYIVTLVSGNKTISRKLVVLD